MTNAEFILALQNAGLPATVTAECTDVCRAMFVRPLSDTEQNTYLDIVDSSRVVSRADFAELKAAVINAINTLLQIENSISPTNAQIIAAVKFEAQTIRQILKVLNRII